MSTPITEFVTFSCTEAYSKQPETTFEPVAGVLRKVPGFTSIHTGPTVEDPTKGFALTRWASLQAHIDFTKTPLFDEFEDALSTALSASIEVALTIEHINFRKDPTQGLGAPVTEVARLTLREGHTHEQAAPILDQLCVGNPDATWGWIVGAKDQAIVETGWPSIEAHIAAVQNGPEGVRLLNTKIQEHMEVKVVHAKLVAF